MNGIISKLLQVFSNFRMETLIALVTQEKSDVVLVEWREAVKPHLLNYIPHDVYVYTQTYMHVLYVYVWPRVLFVLPDL